MLLLLTILLTNPTCLIFTPNCRYTDLRSFLLESMLSQYLVVSEPFLYTINTPPISWIAFKKAKTKENEPFRNWIQNLKLDAVRNTNPPSTFFVDTELVVQTNHHYISILTRPAHARKWPCGCVLIRLNWLRSSEEVGHFLSTIRTFSPRNWVWFQHQQFRRLRNQNPDL